MKKHITIFTVALFCFTIITTKLLAQDAPHADHIALYVKDMDKSVAFYEKVMLFKPIPDPFHNPQHLVWLRTGEHMQLHLILGAKDVPQREINTHYAYAVSDLQAFMKHLDEMQVKYGNWGGEKTTQTRPDGVKQIYLQDPDNYWIEVNDDKY